MRHARVVSALIGALLLGMGSICAADDLQEASKLHKQGQDAQALIHLNKFLAAQPKDAQARFLKGLILAEQKNTAEAIKIFTDLTRDYPELPEPYNNLAVLYAEQEQYDKAKTMLEMAIRTHPSYATAHENLGDIYAKMASQAYSKALQLDKSNTAAQTKLALVTELFSPANPQLPSSGLGAASQSKAASVALAKPAESTPKPQPKAETPKADMGAKIAATAPATPAAKPEIKTEVLVKAAPPPVEKPAATHDGSDSVDILKAINNWAKAWSGKNVAGYLAAYAREFRTPRGEARKEWEQTRRERIVAPKQIEVAIVGPKVKIKDSSHASVSFKQVYRSDTLKASTGKTLEMVKSGDKWLITEERIGR